MNPNKTYIIQHKETKELFRARSGKTSWKQPGHAKNAWNQSIFMDDVRKYGLPMIPQPRSWDKEHKRYPLFSEQDVFEIVELKHESQSKLEEAIELIKYLNGRCDYTSNVMIDKFLENLND